jgi:hypothetical protein
MIVVGSKVGINSKVILVVNKCGAVGSGGVVKRIFFMIAHVYMCTWSIHDATTCMITLIIFFKY